MKVDRSNDQEIKTPHKLKINLQHAQKHKQSLSAKAQRPKDKKATRLQFNALKQPNMDPTTSGVKICQWQETGVHYVMFPAFMII